MTKKRVYELAKDLEWDNKRVIDALARIGVEVKNHMSVIDDAESVLGALKGRAAPPAAAPSSEGGRAAESRTTGKPARTAEATRSAEKPAVRAAERPATVEVQKTNVAPTSPRPQPAVRLTAELPHRPAAELPPGLRPAVRLYNREDLRRQDRPDGRPAAQPSQRPPARSSETRRETKVEPRPVTQAAPAQRPPAANPAVPELPATAQILVDENLAPIAPPEAPAPAVVEKPPAEAPPVEAVAQPLPIRLPQPAPAATGPVGPVARTATGPSLPPPIPRHLVQGGPGPRSGFGPGGPRPAGGPGGPGPRPGFGPGGPRPGGPGPRTGVGPGRPGGGRPGGKLNIPPPPPQVQQQQAQHAQQRPGAVGKKPERRDQPGRWRDGDQRHFDKRVRRGSGPIRTVTQPPKNFKSIVIERPLTVKELGIKIAVNAAEIIKSLLKLGVLVTINQELDVDTIQIVLTEMGYPFEVKLEMTEAEMDAVEEVDNPDDLVSRAPVVTIMGHVDHGKTSLLDAIREARVAAGEAGGITQHIGAYMIELHGRKITFLDTPGHEAFTAMRARGAQVTDVAVLVVAADDGVMPQTVEAINHAKAADVPIVIAINKIDKAGANPDRVKQELTQHGLVSEEWGGETVMVPVSAKQRTNLDQLLEMILLVADVRDLKANANKLARGTIIESKLDKGRGPVATVLIQSGTLHIGDALVAGGAFCKVRAMLDDKGKRVKKAGPSTPVEVLGFAEVPQAGDIVKAYSDEKEARDAAEKRALMRRQSEMTSNSKLTLEDLQKRIVEGELKDLNIIIKADVHGSAEALKGSLVKLRNEEVRVNVVHSGVGAITESDVMLAMASGAIIIGFHVRPDPNARAAAERENVDVRLYRVIYDAVEDIEAAMRGMLKPKLEEVILGHVEIRALFKVPKVGTVAGCYVLDGKINKNAQIRLIRDNVVVFEGKLSSLKRFKDDVREVASGFECGLSLENFNDIKEGDQIEAFTIEEVKPA